MKIVFMGTADFAVGALKALREAGHEIALVVTQPDKPKGRGKEISKSAVKLYAEEWNIPTFQPVKIRLPESIEDCQIPEDVLRSLTNEELILTVLDYPYNEEITLPEGWPMTNQSWGDIRKKTFNGFRELTEREEQSSILQRLNMCHDYIVREYGWEKPRDLLGYLEALIIYLDDSLDENSTIW